MKIKEAMDIIRKELKEDANYYQAWQANIAVAFQDTLAHAGYQFRNYINYQTMQQKYLLNF